MSWKQLFRYNISHRAVWINPLRGTFLNVAFFFSLYQFHIYRSHFLAFFSSFAYIQNLKCLWKAVEDKDVGSLLHLRPRGHSGCFAASLKQNLSVQPSTSHKLAPPPGSLERCIKYNCLSQVPQSAVLLGIRIEKKQHWDGKKKKRQKLNWTVLLILEEFPFLEGGVRTGAWGSCRPLPEAAPVLGVPPTWATLCCCWSTACSACCRCCGRRCCSPRRAGTSGTAGRERPQHHHHQHHYHHLWRPSKRRSQHTCSVQWLCMLDLLHISILSR